MDWLDDGPRVSSRPAAVPSVQAYTKQWPIIAVLCLSVVGVIVAIVCSLTDNALTAGITYLVLLVAGCGLLGYRRYDAILATRSAGGSGIMVIQPIEKAAIAALVISCVATGAVVAVAVSRWV